MGIDGWILFVAQVSRFSETIDFIRPDGSSTLCSYAMDISFDRIPFTIKPSAAYSKGKTGKVDLLISLFKLMHNERQMELGG